MARRSRVARLRCASTIDPRRVRAKVATATPAGRPEDRADSETLVAAGEVKAAALIVPGATAAAASEIAVVAIASVVAAIVRDAKVGLHAAAIVRVVHDPTAANAVS